MRAVHALAVVVAGQSALLLRIGWLYLRPDHVPTDMQSGFAVADGAADAIHVDAILNPGAHTEANATDEAVGHHHTGQVRVWPEEGRDREVCGSDWQDAYAKLHARLVEDGTRTPAQQRVPVRIAVFDCRVGNGGLADRLIGLMTVLLVSILTDRALVINWPGHEEVLMSPRLHLTALLAQAQQAPPHEVRQIRWLQGNRLKLQQQTETDLDLLWPERVLVFQSNRGFTQQLLSSQIHKHAAANRHLTPETAQFGCLLNFLLRPTKAAFAEFEPLRLAMSAPQQYLIGLHIRTGDSAFTARGDSTTASSEAAGARLYAQFQFMFDFALELGATQSLPVQLLLLGDSTPLREYAAQKHPDLILTSHASIGHVARKAASLSHAVVEHWLFSGCDAFVYSSHSGFPRTAAVRSLLLDSIYTCFHYEGPLFSEQQGKPRPKRECTGPYTVYQLGDRHAAGL